MASGYNGKILKVDLSRSSYTIEEKDETFFRTFLGGSALASYYLLTEMDKGAGPLEPENVLVFSTSVIAGAPVPGANRLTVAAKSPLTGYFGESEAGGFFAVELKKAGFEAVVIKGKAPKPVWLWIHDGELEFMDAHDLWGHDLGYAQERIRHQLGDSGVRVAGIGQAGENQVLFASVVNELKHTNGRCGMGAVMGSKNLKALACLGKGKLHFHDPQKLKELGRFYSANFKKHPIQSLLHEGGTIGWDVESLDACGILPTKNFRGGSFADMEKITFTAMEEEVLSGRGRCSGCVIRCKQVCAGGKFDIDPSYGGPEYETVGAFGSNILVSDIQVVAKAHELCNRYTLDTISTGVTIAFAMDCYENGLLTQEDTGGMDLCFGNGEAALQLISDIAFRRGLGALLAEGSARAAEKIGPEAGAHLRVVKKQELAMHEPRGKAGLALQFALNSSGADHVRAPHDLLFEEGKFGVKDLYPLGIYKGLPGVDLGPEKVRFFYHGHFTWNLFNSLSLCVFVAGPGKLFSMNDVVDIVKACTGWETSLYELMKTGERTVNLARLFNTREGLDRKADTLPDRFFMPLESGPLQGNALKKEDFEKALDLYYGMMGWDEMGSPRESTLVALGIHDLSDY